MTDETQDPMNERTATADQVVRELLRETLIQRAGFNYVAKDTLTAVERDLERRGISFEEFVALPEHQMNALVHDCEWPDRFWTRHYSTWQDTEWLWRLVVVAVANVFVLLGVWAVASGELERLLW